MKAYHLNLVTQMLIRDLATNNQESPRLTANTSELSLLSIDSGDQNQEVFGDYRKMEYFRVAKFSRFCLKNMRINIRDF